MDRQHLEADLRFSAAWTGLLEAHGSLVELLVGAASSGGEEFAILLPRTGAAEAARVIERLRATIPRIAIPGGGPVSPLPSGVTVSIGVAASAGATRNLLDFLAAAGHALYQAKNAGRNRVQVIGDDASSGPFPNLASRS